MNDSPESKDPIDSALKDIKPSTDPTPAQAVRSITSLAMAGLAALIALIVAAAAYVLTHFKQ